MVQKKQPENIKRRSNKYRRRKKEQEARQALNPKLPGTCRRRLPESLRVLYGASEQAERRLFDIFDRAREVDEYLQSHTFEACDYCKVGWLSPGKSPIEGVGYHSTAKKMAFHLAKPEQWSEDGGKRICTKCLEEVEQLEKEAKKQASAVPISGAAPSPVPYSPLLCPILPCSAP